MHRGTLSVQAAASAKTGRCPDKRVLGNDFGNSGHPKTQRHHSCCPLSRAIDQLSKKCFFCPFLDPRTQRGPSGFLKQMMGQELSKQSQKCRLKNASPAVLGLQHHFLDNYILGQFLSHFWSPNALFGAFWGLKGYGQANGGRSGPQSTILHGPKCFDIRGLWAVGDGGGMGPL